VDGRRVSRVRVTAVPEPVRPEPEQMVLEQPVQEPVDQA